MTQIETYYQFVKLCYIEQHLFSVKSYHTVYLTEAADKKINILSNDKFNYIFLQMQTQYKQFSDRKNDDRNKNRKKNKNSKENSQENSNNKQNNNENSNNKNKNNNKKSSSKKNNDDEEMKNVDEKNEDYSDNENMMNTK